MKGRRIFVVAFDLFFSLLSFSLFCFQFYEYDSMLSLIVRWFSVGVFTVDLFQHGHVKSQLNFKLFLLSVNVRDSKMYPDNNNDFCTNNKKVKCESSALLQR